MRAEGEDDELRRRERQLQKERKARLRAEEEEEQDLRTHAAKRTAEREAAFARCSKLRHKNRACMRRRKGFRAQARQGDEEDG